MRSHDEYNEMTAAHALGALATADAHEVEAHLSTCDTCRAEFDSWKETASSLAFAAETAVPSPDVRSRVLKQARALSSSVSESSERPFETIADNVAQDTSSVIPIRPPKRRAWTGGEVFMAIAASLVIAVLLGMMIVLWRQTKAMKTDVERLSRQVDASQQELARVREEKALLTAPDARLASLTGTEMAKNARAMIAYDRATGRAMLVANGLPPAPEGQAYQLWFIPKGKQPIPGVVFSTDAAGHAEMHDVVPMEGRDGAVFAVTLERAGGVQAPQGKIYLQSSAT